MSGFITAEDVTSNTLHHHEDHFTGSVMWYLSVSVEMCVFPAWNEHVEALEQSHCNVIWWVCTLSLQATSPLATHVNFATCTDHAQSFMVNCLKSPPRCSQRCLTV